MKNIIRVNDNLQTYHYTTTEKEGLNFSQDFTPDLTPKQMLEIGVFGGNYFEGHHNEFPSGWFKNAKMSNHHDVSLNFFKVDASQSRQEWQRKVWINEEDPRGWFQWYCRYYLGRRIPEEDKRQIKRWKQIHRHIAQIKKACHEGDILCRPRQRQAVLHWAYDSTKI